MGHKTHPLGFRLGITHTHNSAWFSDFKNYSKFLKEDDELRKSIFNFYQNLNRANIAKIGIHRNSDANSIQIRIFTAGPSSIVGKGGIRLNQLREKLLKLLNNNYQIWIKLIRIENPFTEAELVAQIAVQELEERIPFRRVVKQTMEKIATNKGGKLQISGRLGGAEIARSEWTRHKRIPLQTLRADIDYAITTAHTIYGVLGIKVWLFKSELNYRPNLISDNDIFVDENEI